MSNPWECPRCKRINAPTTPFCSCNHSPSNAMSIGIFPLACNHEWDGVILNRPYAANLGLCKHCGQECYAASIE